MKDPVALAYSGRIDEAREAAFQQASSNDDFLVRQGLEALAVLGQQHGVRTNVLIDALLRRRATESPTISRKAFDAAMSIGSRALEEEAARRLEEGATTWEVLRYTGEWPSLRLARALRARWDDIPERLRDEALLTLSSMPAASEEEARECGRLAIDGSRHPSADIRIAAFTALRYWVPLETADLCARALRDESKGVRTAAAQLLAELDPDRLIELAQELGEESPEAQGAVQAAHREKLRRLLNGGFRQ